MLFGESQSIKRFTEETVEYRFREVEPRVSTGVNEDINDRAIKQTSDKS